MNGLCKNATDRGSHICRVIIFHITNKTNKMNPNVHKPMKLGILISAMMLIHLFANGTGFTAVANGNWSNTATWGGTMPAFSNTLDQITIPAGVTVTMDNDVTLNGATTSLTIMGTLSSTAGNLFTLTTGTVSGTGTIIADNIALGAGAALLFTGSLTANNIVNSAFSLQTAASLQVNQTLTLAAGTLSIQAGGSLAAATNTTIIVAGGQLALNGGSLAFGSNYNVTYNTGTTVAGVELTGTGLQNVTINAGALNTVTLSNNLTVHGTLTLTSGTLVLGTHNFTLTGNIAAAGTGNMASTIASNITINSPNTIAGTIHFTGMASGVNNFTMNIGSTNQATISGPLNIGGTFTLSSGVLVLNAANLTFSGDLSVSGNGTLSSTANSNIAINTADSPSGDLKFTAGSNTVDSLSINIGNGGSVLISSNLNINATLHLTAGHLDIGNNTLTMAALATITGANANAYIITGATGSLAIPVATAGILPTNYPIGTATDYFPATVLLNTGSAAGTVDIGVVPQVYENGTSGATVSAFQDVVNATWYVHSDIVSSLDLNLQVMWPASAEINGFHRATSYISHYTGGSWDASATLAATAVAGGLFSQVRTNLTSLSPFSVFDQTTAAGVTETLNSLTVAVYPNPASSNIYINNLDMTHGPYTAQLTDLFGHNMSTYQLHDVNNMLPIDELPAGVYFLNISNGTQGAVKRFTKI